MQSFLEANILSQPDYMLCGIQLDCWIKLAYDEIEDSLKYAFRLGA